MNCKFCRKSIPDNASFCCYCGKKQSIERHRRGNGTGSVYKRGNTYTVRIRSCQYGNRMDRTKGGFKTKAEALLYVPQLIARKDRSKIGFWDLWERIQKTERYQKLSQDKKTQWGYAIDKLDMLHGIRDMREIDYGMLQDQLEGLTFYPARDIRTVLIAMYTLAQKYGYVENNPAQLLDLPPLVEKEKEVFSDVELQQIWNCQHPFRDYILIMCYTGLRPIELRSLLPENIDITHHYLIGGKKTELSKQSKIVFPDIVDPLLKHYQPIRDKSNKWFYKKFYDCLDAAGIEWKDRISPNSCRHTFITRLSKITDSIAVLKSAARHTNYQTTLRYTHINTDEVSSVVNKLSTSDEKNA